MSMRVMKQNTVKDKTEYVERQNSLDKVFRIC